MKQTRDETRALLRVIAEEMKKQPVPDNAVIVLPEIGQLVSGTDSNHVGTQAHPIRTPSHPFATHDGNTAPALVRATPGGFMLPEGIRVTRSLDTRVRRNNDGSRSAAGWVVERLLPDSITEVGWSDDFAVAIRMALREIRRIAQLRANLGR